MRIIFLTPDDDEAWAAMPFFIRRVVEFAQKHTPEEDIRAQAFNAITEFTLGKGGYFGAVLLKDDELCGHALWSLDSDESLSQKWVTIHQVELDKDAGLSSSDRAKVAGEFLELIHSFAKKAEASEIRLLALSEAHARYYKRYGFAVKRFLMAKPLPQSGGRDGININNDRKNTH